jgi:hypothetical protein
MQPHVPGFPWPRVEESVEEGSEDSQDVEPEQENMNTDKKLSDDMKLSSGFMESW